uniref:Uncharacterized protein n=1 Tax=Sphaerodactylus townsendi TaxID=933632 RepID=A0ACB8G8U8_9SAUR
MVSVSQELSGGACKTPLLQHPVLPPHSWGGGACFGTHGPPIGQNETFGGIKGQVTGRCFLPCCHLDSGTICIFLPPSPNGLGCPCTSASGAKTTPLPMSIIAGN